MKKLERKVFREVMDQVENFKENEDVDYNEVKTTPAPVISMYAHIEEEDEMMMAAEDI